MCGRYQFTMEQYAEIFQIVREVERRYGEQAWKPGEIRPTAQAPVRHEPQRMCPDKQLLLLVNMVSIPLRW